MPKFSSRSFTIILIFSFLPLFGCSSSISGDVNKSFLAQYGKDVAKINNRREDLARPDPGPRLEQQQAKSGWLDPAYILGTVGTENYRTAFVDTSGLVLPPPPEQYLPDGQTWAEKRGSLLPGTIFSVEYLNENYPYSYKVAPVSFDDIQVPDYDIFGVASNMREKDYILIDTMTLRNNINDINSRVTPDDRRNILTLVSEQKELQQSKREKVLTQLAKDEDLMYQAELKKQKEEADKRKKEKELKRQQALLKKAEAERKKAELKKQAEEKKQAEKKLQEEKSAELYGKTTSESADIEKSTDTNIAEKPQDNNDVDGGNSASSASANTISASQIKASQAPKSAESLNNSQSSAAPVLPNPTVN